MNVSYTVDQLASKNRPLNDKEKALVQALEPIEDEFPVPTPEEQRAQLDKLFNKDDSEEEVDHDFNDDIAF